MAFRLAIAFACAFATAPPALAATVGSGDGPDGSPSSGGEGVKVVDAGNTGRALIDVVTVPGTEPVTGTVANVF